MTANRKAVKLRMKSIQSTMQNTKAMELVASSKLKKAREQADSCRPYFKILCETLTEIAVTNTDFVSVYSRPQSSSRWCYVVIAGDRGLAGGYHSNLFKLVQAEINQNDGEYAILPIGKKAVEHYHRSCRFIAEDFEYAARVSVSDCFEIAKELCRLYKKGEYGHIVLCHTSFRSMLSQEPKASSLLPLSDFSKTRQKKSSPFDSENSTEETDKKKPRSLILYEPDSETVFDSIVPEYLAGLIHSGLCDSLASELAARRTAMEAATKNAGEMLKQLELYYNRARQTGITQEITEIVAGAEGV